MRKQLLAALLTAFSTALLFVRCTRLEQEPPQTPAEFPLLLSTTATLDSNNYTRQSTFTYNPDSTLATIITKYWDAATPNNTKVDFTVQATKQPNGLPYNTHTTKENPAFDYTMQYLQLPGHQMVERKTYVNWPKPNVEERWYGLDAKNRIIADTIINFYTHEIDHYTLNTYDVNDNVVKFEGYSADSLGNFVHSYTTVYTYDQHPNPFYSLKYVQWTETGFYTYFGKNNMLTHFVTDHLTGDAYNVFDYTYEYNSLGLPTKRYEHDHGITIAYQYKD